MGRPHGQSPGGVLGQSRRLGRQGTPYVARAAQQRLPIHPQEGGRNQSHGRQYGVTPPQPFRNRQRAQKMVIRLVPQKAGLGVRHHKQMFLPGAGQTFLQPGQNKKVLRHGFDGPARLADHRHQRFLRRQFFQKGFKSVGVHVVGYPQPGTVMAGPVLGGKKGFLQGARAQSRSAYAQYQHMAKTMQKFRMSVQLPAQLLREGQSQKREFRQGTFQPGGIRFRSGHGIPAAAGRTRNARSFCRGGKGRPGMRPIKSQIRHGSSQSAFPFQG